MDVSPPVKDESRKRGLRWTNSRASSTIGPHTIGASFSLSAFSKMRKHPIRRGVHWVCKTHGETSSAAVAAMNSRRFVRSSSQLEETGAEHQVSMVVGFSRCVKMLRRKCGAWRGQLWVLNRHSDEPKRMSVLLPESGHSSRAARGQLWANRRHSRLLFNHLVGAG